MSLEDDIERVIDALEKQEREVMSNMIRQLRAIKDRLRSNRYYMAESGRAVLGAEYQQRQPQQQDYFDPDAWPTRRN